MSIPTEVQAKAIEPSAWAAFRATLVRFQRDQFTPWLAFRNTLGLTIPLAAGAAFGAVPIGVAMATGALNVCFSDSYQPYPQRFRRMLAACVLVGIGVAAGGLAGRNDTAAVLVAGAWALAAGMLVSLSAAAADLGAMSLVTLVVFAATPQPVERALYAGLLAFAGGLLQMAFSLALWPIRRYVHERQALGDLYIELSAAAAAPAQVLQAPPASAQSTKAQESVALLHRNHSPEAERYLLLLTQAERIRLGLLTLARLRGRIRRELPDALEGEILTRYGVVASGILRWIGTSLRAGHAAGADPGALKEMQALSEQLRASQLPPPVDHALRDARVQMDALTGQFRSAADLATSASPAGEAAFDRRESRRPWRLRLAGTLATLRANMSLDSAACRHAIRLAACIALGDALARGLDLRRSYWVPMTIAILLKPDFTATFSRGVLRLIGTFAGLLLATALFHQFHPMLGMEVALLAAMMFILRCFGAANYGLFVTALTALVVLLFAIAGIAPAEMIVPRAVNTAVGGLIALLAYWLWPTWERRLVPSALAQLLDAYRLYFRAIREGYVKPEVSFARDLDRTRLAARLARSNVEASIDRLTAEPGASAQTVAVLSVILANSHRLVHAIMALEAGLYTSNPVPARTAYQGFSDQVELTLYYLAAALRGSPITVDQLPRLREYHHLLVNSGDGLTERYALVNVETDRITNSLNTLSEQLLQWIGAGARS